MTHSQTNIIRVVFFQACPKFGAADHVLILLKTLRIPASFPVRSQIVFSGNLIISYIKRLLLFWADRKILVHRKRERFPFFTLIKYFIMIKL